MTLEELCEEISIELELIESILQELSALRKDTAGRKPTVREKTAAATFMAQFYSGVENILKRISRFNSVNIPTGDAWHIDLFKRFCEPSYTPLPALFDEPLSLAMAPFRKFRQVVYHGYGFQLDWSRMLEGIESIDDVFSRFKLKVLDYLQTQKNCKKL
ncbi:MAG TPA: hypothetical protein VI387_14090 [Candidatus Brocadiales bacterium]|nr:hypothetical protein [Candidatus Brocadiales bacterium]